MQGDEIGLVREECDEILISHQQMRSKEVKAITKMAVTLGFGALLAVLSGCTTLTPMSEIATLPKKGDGILFVQVGLFDPHTAESICAAFPGVKDERCEHKEQYDGVMVAPGTRFWSTDKIPLLVPKTAGVQGLDILKIRIDGNRPAIFEFIAAKGPNVKDCYYDGMYGPHTGGVGGVVCPKYDWNYKRDLTRY